jgi:glucose-1-phosphate adenylyltransferase
LTAETIENLGLQAQPGQVLASMGIYLFRSPSLIELMQRPGVDFGKEIIPGAIGNKKVMAFLHNDYWEDIGTIRAFHSASLAMTTPLPPLDLYSRDRPVYTNPRFLPGTKINRCDVEHAILCEGSILSDSTIRRTIIGIRAVVREGSTVEDAVIMGARFYEREDPTSGIPQGIGRNCHVRNAIVDLDACIGDGVKLLNEARVEEADGDGWCIRGGVIVVPRGAVIEPGTVV